MTNNFRGIGSWFDYKEHDGIFLGVLCCLYLFYSLIVVMATRLYVFFKLESVYLKVNFSICKLYLS